MVLKTVNMYSPNGDLYLVNESDIADFKAKGFTQRKKNTEKVATKAKAKAEVTDSKE